MLFLPPISSCSCSFWTLPFPFLFFSAVSTPPSVKLFLRFPSLPLLSLLLLLPFSSLRSLPFSLHQFLLFLFLRSILFLVLYTPFPPILSLLLLLLPFLFSLLLYTPAHLSFIRPSLPSVLISSPYSYTAIPFPYSPPFISPFLLSPSPSCHLSSSFLRSFLFFLLQYFHSLLSSLLFSFLRPFLVLSSWLGGAYGSGRSWKRRTMSRASH